MEWTMSRDQLLALWDRFVDSSVFPPSELRDQMLQRYSSQLPYLVGKRQKERRRVDALLEKLLRCSSAVERLELLNKTPPTTVLMVVERTIAVLQAFDFSKHEPSRVRFPSSVPSRGEFLRQFFRDMLFQRPLT